MPTRPRVLILSDYYLPGFKAGGPIRTISNLVEGLGELYDFMVFTRDRDLGDKKPYSMDYPLEFKSVGKAKVLYLSSPGLTLRALRNLLAETEFDMLYLNSAFSPKLTIQPLLLNRLGRIRQTPIVVAPRGEFGQGALRQSGRKKKVFLDIARRTGLYRDVLWQASSLFEADEIKRCLGGEVRVRIAPNVVQLDADDALRPRRPKRPGAVRILFASRISRKKNLLFLLDLLARAGEGCSLTIAGPIDDPRYWRQCCRRIDAVGDRVSITYVGPVLHEQVGDLFREHDLLCLPTLNENFGQVIFEALAAGCPVLLSDRTPWRDLEAEGIGWDIPLERPDLFMTVLSRMVALSTEQHEAMSANARHFAASLASSGSSEQQAALFDEALLGGIGRTRQLASQDTR